MLDPSLAEPARSLRALTEEESAGNDAKAGAEKRVSDSLDAALDAIASRVRTAGGGGVPVLVFNPTSRERAGTIEAAVAPDPDAMEAPTVRDAETGQAAPCRAVMRAGGRGTVAFHALPVPAFGYRLFFVSGGGGGDAGPPPVEGGAEADAGPLLARVVAPHAGHLPVRHAFLRVKTEGDAAVEVRLGVPGGIRIGLRETGGRAAAVEVALPAAPSSVRDDAGRDDRIAAGGARLRVPLAPGEVRTLHVEF
jgi:hypothetical protein